MKKYRELPVINVRDLVIFPKMHIPLFIGREFTIDAILHAKEKCNGRLFVFSQKSGEKEKPFKKTDMYPIGTECKIVESVLYPDKSMKVLLESVKTFKLHKLMIKDKVRFAQGEGLRKETPLKLTKEQREEILCLLVRWNPRLALVEDSKALQKISKIRNNNQFLAQVFRAFCITRPQGSKKKRVGGPSIPKKKELKIINQGIFDRQTILSEANSGKKLKLIMNLLKQECIRELK